ncbi:UrcA family protein [Maricaulaceae bacterium EIL42A08]|nr:UrcA family protein [Maricaulaceae bacterium EIL42A08]
MKSLILFAAAATALSAAPVAFADDHEAVITYEQSQLGSARGVADLRYEIRQAAEEVCVAPANPTYAERRAQAECVEAAIEAGEAQLQQKLADAGLRRFAENRTIRVAAAR